MPTPAELSRSGVRLAESMERAKPLREAMQKFAKAGEMAGEGPDPIGTARETPLTPLVQLGCGLATLLKKLLERIENDEYVDFNELPPAKGKGRSMAQARDGRWLWYRQQI